MFQGGIQALSRSHFAKIIPAEKSGDANIGVGSLVILFIAGFVLFNKSLGRDMEVKTINAEYAGVVTAAIKKGFSAENYKIRWKAL